MPYSTYDNFTVLLSKFDLCLWKKDIATNQYLFLSDATAKLYGIQKATLAKNPDAWLDLVHPLDLPLVLSSADKLKMEATEVDITYRIVKKNGSVRWIRDLKRSFANEDGQVVTIEGLAEDITDRKIIEERLAINEKRYRLYFENNPKPMWVYDCDTLHFLEVNKAAVRIYGFSREEFKQMKITDIRPADEVASLLDSVKKLKTGMNHSRAWTHINKKLDLFKVEISGYVFQEGDKKKELVVVNDITNVLNYAEKIEAFAYMTSHQVRRPLANILALVDLMSLEKDPHQKEALCNSLVGCAQELDQVLQQAAKTIRKQSKKNTLLESFFNQTSNEASS